MTIHYSTHELILMRKDLRVIADSPIVAADTANRLRDAIGFITESITERAMKERDYANAKIC